jgi:hypothetical protein
MEPRRHLPWLAGGLLLGGVLLVAVALAQPLGVTTQYVRAVGGACEALCPDVAAASAYFAKEKLVFGYGEMVVIGVPLGALLVSLLQRRLGRGVSPEAWTVRFGASPRVRALGAFAGGFLLLFGARMAGGCTSGHVLSGVSQLAVSSILFMAAAFGSALVAARLLYGKAVRS